MRLRTSLRLALWLSAIPIVALAAAQGGPFDAVLSRLGLNEAHRKEAAASLLRGVGVRLDDGTEITPNARGVRVVRRGAAVRTEQAATIHNTKGTTRVIRR